MKEKIDKKSKKVRYGLIIALVTGIMFVYATVPTPEVLIDEETGSWHVIWKGNLAQAAEYDPANDSSTILSVYFHPHQVDVGGYNENSSSNLETNCTGGNLGFANGDDQEVDLAHSTEFDIVVRVRGNDTHCKVGATWFNSNLRVHLTCADLTIDQDLTLAAGEAMTTHNASDSTYLYMNFFDTNSGSGFTISQDQTVEITEISLEAYY